MHPSWIFLFCALWSQSFTCFPICYAHVILPSAGATSTSTELLFLLCLPLLKTLGQTSVIHMTQPFMSWGDGQGDLYFIVEQFCLIAWRLFDVWTSSFGIMSWYNPMFDLKINVGHYELCFMVDWFYLISCMNIILLDYESVWLAFDHKINVGHCDLYFVIHWFCLIAWRLFDVWTSYFGIMSWYNPTFDLKINIGHCDLYFMVH